MPVFFNKETFVKEKLLISSTRVLLSFQLTFFLRSASLFTARQSTANLLQEMNKSSARTYEKLLDL